ncbi:TELO2-interacting protein 2-like isoform X2 [Hypomesus transpacificus]|uniref:TELO2-interacting protein 2-like isoform X2 n=1 Tax=Hypomesus transpacificus TaxID=137520 RepID=UPI001F084027|nr:TELO2-interacting protein 2-like isoform X2 [Hypomesus transpacificus]XP_046904321.1 TELO2-interacting protein 2-like isoform X2 [Hypomesus transpacificus]
MPCLWDLLPMLEKSPVLTVASWRPNRYDAVLRLVLSHMEVEHKLPLRRVYAGILPLFIDRATAQPPRLHLCPWRCDGPEEQSRIAILDALEKTITVAWSRWHVRGLADVSSEDTSAAVDNHVAGKDNMPDINTAG